MSNSSVSAFVDQCHIYIPFFDLEILNTYAWHPEDDDDVLTAKIEKIWDARDQYSSECLQKRTEINEKELCARIKGISDLKELTVPFDQTDELNQLVKKYERIDVNNYFAHKEIKAEKEEIRISIQNKIMALFPDFRYNLAKPYEPY